MSLPLYCEEGLVEVGIDEAGRGCLAGPVVVAGVILPTREYIYDMCESEEEKEYNDRMLAMINDSKKMSHSKRMKVKDYIQSIAIDYVTAFVSETYIDEHNILSATVKGIKEVVSGLQVKPEHILIDGTFPKKHTFGAPHTYVLEGDATYASIAAASILAKTYRDEYVLNEMHPQFPVYNWDKNKGYGTKAHYDAILEHGISERHRKSFRLV